MAHARAVVIPAGRETAYAYRALPDGRELVLYRMLFTWRLCVGDQGARTYDRHYCFPVGGFDRARDVLETWDGVGDPPEPFIKSSRD